MPKRKPLSARDIIKVLLKHGFEKVGQKGSHIRFKKKVGKKAYITVVPNYREIGPVVFSSIVRRSGLTKEDFYC